MHFIDMQKAVREIVRATTRRTGTDPTAFPFFVIIGAGVSAPSIPLASGIEQLCRKEITEQGLEQPSTGGNPMDRYEECFVRAFPHAEERQAFLHDRIHRARISSANLRLAHLLESGKFTNLVVTSNFDELLARGLRLFGKDFVVCDHPKTTQRIDPRRAEVLQIVHVHGTHWFYDICNLKGEIHVQARPDQDDNVSMIQLLGRILFDRSPVVVGYSGWEGDVIMTALASRLKQPTLPHNLYWFCHQRSDADLLPAWLKQHGSVRIIVPVAQTETQRGDRSTSAIASTLLATGPQGAMDDPRATEPVLTAQMVFEALNTGFELTSPSLTVDPLRFFADQLEENLESDTIDDGKDVYLIRQVIARVREGMRLEIEFRDRQTIAQRETSESLARMSDAVRRSAYAEAIHVAQGIHQEYLTEPQRVELDAVLEEAYLNIHTSDAAIGLAACEMRIDIAKNMLDAAHDGDKQWAVRIAKAIHGKGHCLSVLARHGEAISAYEEIEQRFGSATDLALRDRVARALNNKGFVLIEDGQRAEALAAWDEVEQRFGSATESVLQEQVVDALVNKGDALGKEGRRAEAIATYQRVERRFGSATEPVLRGGVAVALINKGWTLAEDGRLADAIAAYEEVDRRFGSATEPALRERVAWAFINKGNALFDDGRPPEAITTYEEVDRRFGSATEPGLRERVADALFNKGLTLAEGGRSAEALAAFEEIDRRFGSATEPALREQVAKALSNRGWTFTKENRFAEAILAYEAVVARYALDPSPPLQALVNQAKSAQASIRK